MGDFYRSIWSMLCVTMCNFIMYHTEIGICHKLKQIAAKNTTKNAKCAELTALLSLTQINNAGNLRPDTNPTQGKNA